MPILQDHDPVIDPERQLLVDDRACWVNVSDSVFQGMWRILAAHSTIELSPRRSERWAPPGPDDTVAALTLARDPPTDDSQRGPRIYLTLLNHFAANAR
jgi:hypothetical protein